MVREEDFTLERINKGLEDEPNNLNWYGLKFSILLIKEKYEELLDCIDEALQRTQARNEVLLELRRQVVEKIQMKAKQ